MSGKGLQSGQLRNSSNLVNDWTSINSLGSFPGLGPKDSYAAGGTLSNKGGGPQATGGGFRNAALSRPASAVDVKNTAK